MYYLPSTYFTYFCTVVELFFVVPTEKLDEEEEKIEAKNGHGASSADTEDGNEDDSLSGEEEEEEDEGSSEEDDDGGEEEDDEDSGEAPPPKRSFMEATGLKMSAAGLCVHVGSFSDPQDIPGLAHFLGNQLDKQTICVYSKHSLQLIPDQDRLTIWS